MKKTGMTLCMAACCACLMSFSSFAMTKAEYRDASKAVRTELQAVNAQISELNDSNKAFNSSYKSVIQTKKATGELPIDKSDWRAARELRKEITAVKQTMPESMPKEDKALIRSYAQEKNYDAAYVELTKLLENRRARLSKLTEINTIWNEIDPLLH